MPNRILLAVDLSYQIYRAAAAHPKLTTSSREFTGGLYGFLMSLAKTINETRATVAVICEDHKPYRRSLIYPEYKLLRKKSQDPDLVERFEVSKPQVLAAIEQIGLPRVGFPGFESDDCIGALLLRHRSRFARVYAASNDSDLYQWLDVPQFRVYRKDLADCMDAKTLYKETGLTPAQFMLASALTGTHNDIAGIPNVGPVNAAKAIKDPAKMRAYREQHAAVIDRNLELIKLPHPEFPASILLPAPVRSFNHRAFTRFCARYDIHVTQAMIDAFSQVCP